MPKSKKKTRFQIESDIPFPADPPKSASGRPNLYPFAEMKIGQSIFVATDERYFSRLSSLSAALTRARKKTRYNLQWRQAPGGFRIFRYPGECQMRQRKKAAAERLRANPKKLRVGK